MVDSGHSEKLLIRMSEIFGIFIRKFDENKVVFGVNSFKFGVESRLL